MEEIPSLSFQNKKTQKRGLGVTVNISFPIVFLTWFFPPQTTRQVSLPLSAVGRSVVTSVSQQDLFFPISDLPAPPKSPCSSGFLTCNITSSIFHQLCKKYIICQMTRCRGKKDLTVLQTEQNLPKDIWISCFYLE